MSVIIEKIKELGYELPEPSTPIASYIPAIQAGNLIYTSGNLPVKEGKLVYIGKIGKNNNSNDYGYKAAELCILNALSSINNLIGLDNIKKIVKLTGYVNSEEDFTEQAAVINGASNLIVDIFGETGKHARAAVGVASLPLGATVEIELIVEAESK